MNITPTTQKDNALLGRNELSAHITFDTVTPKNADVQQLVAQLLKSDEKLVVIKHIHTNFGRREAEVFAYVYNDENAKQLYEPKPKVKKAKEEKKEEAKK
jgi:small subunit ribosomal protein S24e